MNPAIGMWTASLFFGIAAAIVSFCGRGYFARLLDLIERDLSGKQRRMRASMGNLRRAIIGWLIATGGVFLALLIVADSLIFALLACLFLVCTPWYLLHRAAARRRQKIEDQLADTMVMLANAVRAGLALSQSLEILAQQCPAPINAEFRQIVNEYQMGRPLEQTLTEAKQRLRSENFSLFAAALLASHESGGRLNETVERIATSVRELERLRRKVRSETAQARRSAAYMAMIPAVVLVVYYFVDPRNTMLLFTEVVGHMLLSIVVVLDVVAYAWARVILNPDI
ncbi:MAG: type II secretion system F family protein [Candidatus Nealsonbacteria bacterium]|nr:type II secretion system F family protein [Candidatus Nealsonbacteria bacterium]